jgi:hypothetical protein
MGGQTAGMSRYSDEETAPLVGFFKKTEEEVRETMGLQVLDIAGSSVAWRVLATMEI